MPVRLSRFPPAATLRRFEEAALKKAALAAVEIIRKRTAAGKDIHGQPFKSYTPDYRNRKASSGRNVEPPDFTVTGQLLGALKFLRTDGPERAWIGWSGSHRDAQFKAVRENVEHYDEEWGITHFTKGDVKKTRIRAAGPQRMIKRGKNKGQLRKAPTALVTKYRVERKSTSTPFAEIVPALHARRPFFGIVTKAEIAEIRRIYLVELNHQLSRWADSQRRRSN